MYLKSTYTLLLIASLLGCKTVDNQNLTVVQSSRCSPVDGYQDALPTNKNLVEIMNKAGWPKKDGLVFGVDQVTENRAIPITDRQYLLIHDYIINNLNCKTKTPAWVINELQDQFVNRQYCRESSFKEDYFKKIYNITDCEHTSSDYTNSGFQRGHLAPAMDFAGYSSLAIQDSNLTTNIAPQIGPGFNEHLWKELEETVRIWSKQKYKLLIITGVIHTNLNRAEKIQYFRGDATKRNSEQGIKTTNKNKIMIVHENKPEENLENLTSSGIGNSNAIKIPDYYYKFVIELDRNENIVSVLPFLMKNIDHSKIEYPHNKVECLNDDGSVKPASSCPENDNGINFKRHLVNIDTIEELSGYDFFSKLNLDETKVPEIWEYPGMNNYRTVN